MNIPKKVQKLIDRRCRLALQLADVSYELDAWLDKNGVECESFDTHTGVEIYGNPVASKRRVTEAILEKEVSRK